VYLKYHVMQQQVRTNLFSFDDHFRNFWWSCEVLRFKCGNFWYVIDFNPYLFFLFTVNDCDREESDLSFCAKTVTLLKLLTLLRFTIWVDWFGGWQSYTFF
jgi:hypothetical protein